MIEWYKTSEKMPPKDNIWIIAAFKSDRWPDGYLYAVFGAYLIWEDAEDERPEYWAYVNNPKNNSIPIEMAIKYNKETHTFEKCNDFVWRRPVEEIAAALVEQYNRQEERLRALQEENEKLKKNCWKDEELCRMKVKLDKAETDLYRGFGITEEQDKKIREFIEQYSSEDFGAIGGAFTYVFTPTSIGTVGKIVGPDGKEMEFQSIG